jgi:hypothetical protein
LPEAASTEFESCPPRTSDIDSKNAEFLLITTQSLYDYHHYNAQQQEKTQKQEIFEGETGGSSASSKRTRTGEDNSEGFTRQR